MKTINRAVWKFPLQVGGVSEVTIPLIAKILSVHAQGEGISLWALVDVDNADATVVRRFAVVPTGAAVPDGPLSFLGTVLLHGGRLVFHVFELTEEDEA